MAQGSGDAGSTTMSRKQPLHQSLGYRRRPSQDGCPNKKLPRHEEYAQTSAPRQADPTQHLPGGLPTRPEEERARKPRGGRDMPVWAKRT